MECREENDIAAPSKRKGRSLPTEQHYFRFEQDRNMLSDEEQRLLERDRHRAREKQRRENMTDEQRSLERERRRIRDEERRKSMSDEQRSLEKERRRIRERQRRINMNDEQRALEMERRRVRERQHRQNMNDEQICKDRERRRQRDKQRRESMNDEQKAQERERRRLYEVEKRGSATNERGLAHRRRELARNQLLISQNDQISSIEEDEQNALYSSDAYEGKQSIALAEYNLQVEMINSSEHVSTSILELNEGAMNNFNHVVGGQKSSDSTDVTEGNQFFAFKQDNMKLEVFNTSEHSSTTTTLDLIEGTMEFYSASHVDDCRNTSHSTDAVDVNLFFAFKEENQEEVEAINTSENSSTRIVDLNEGAIRVKNGRETVGVHIGEEGNNA